MIYILIDRVRSLYNVGSIFRIADAVGAQTIFLNKWSGGVKIGEKMHLHTKIAKTALKGIDVKWKFIKNSCETVKQLKTAGVQIIALEQTSKSVDYRLANYKEPLCLIVGHELDGVSQELIALSDLIIELPMLGKGKSLNVACASAIALYKINEIVKK